MKTNWLTESFLNKMSYVISSESKKKRNSIRKKQWESPDSVTQEPHIKQKKIIRQLCNPFNVVQILVTEQQTKDKEEKTPETNGGHKQTSSLHIFIWKSRHVSFLQGIVYFCDQFIDLLLHRGCKRVIIQFLGVGTLELSLQLTLEAEQTLL